MDFIARHGQTFEAAATARQAASGDHCRQHCCGVRFPEGGWHDQEGDDQRA
jgi:hypothetical protein